MKGSLYENLPESPGVYLMEGVGGKILYIGKAANLKRRVSSYFLRPIGAKGEKMLSEIQSIDYRLTDTTIEALILEARLIKKFLPPYNVKEKDDKSFLYVEITNEKFPRVLLVRGREARTNAEQTRTNPEAEQTRYSPRWNFGEAGGAGAENIQRKSALGQRKSAAKQYGPFTSVSSIREALRILRRIFPWSLHAEIAGSNGKNNSITPQKTKFGSGHSNEFVDSDCISRRRPCFDHELGLCPGTCIGAISRKDYLKNIGNIKLFFEGKKTEL